MVAETRTVLIGLDGSQTSRASLLHYLDYVANENDNLWLASVFDPPSLDTTLAFSGTFLVPDEYEERLSKAVETQKLMVSTYCNEAKNHKNCEVLHLNVQSKLLQPSDKEVGECLLNFAHEINADFIIVGSSRSNFLKRTFLGSVSTYLVHNSNGIPVVIGPPDYFQTTTNSG